MFNNISMGCGCQGGGYGYPQMGGPGRGPGGPRGRRGPKGPMGAKIREGIQNGSISRDEAQQLRSTRQEMKQLKSSAMADGQISPEERSQLQSYRQQMRQMVSQFSQG